VKTRWGSAEIEWLIEEALVWSI